MSTTTTAPLRALTAVALCDGHDAAIVAVSRALRLHGMEVVYVGFHKSPRQIVQAAVQEDVDVIGLSSYNGGHLEFIEDMVRHLREMGRDIPVVCGGGGTITPDDVRELTALGVARVFLPGETLDQMAEAVRGIAGARRAQRALDQALVAKALGGDFPAMGRLISIIEDDPSTAEAALSLAPGSGDGQTFVLGISGPGGAGKSTLIDELALRWLAARKEPVAVLCSDPTGIAREPGEVGGALLGDRLRMLATDHSRMFVRSFATRRAGAISGTIEPLLRVLRRSAFPLVIVESAGIGQADHPFGAEVDMQLLVMTDEFGSPIQLEKLAAMETADLVVLNKCDRPAASAAASMIRARLRSVKRPGRPAVELVQTSASRHRDPGVDGLFQLMLKSMGSKVPQVAG